MKQAHYGGPWAPTWSSSSLRLPEFTLVAGLGLGTKSLLARGTRPVGVGLRPCWLCCPQYPAHAGMRWALAGIWAGGGGPELSEVESPGCLRGEVPAESSRDLPGWPPPWRSPLDETEPGKGCWCQPCGAELGPVGREPGCWEQRTGMNGPCPGGGGLGRARRPRA